jgi:hypothetical protein
MLTLFSSSPGCPARFPEYREDAGGQPGGGWGRGKGIDYERNLPMNLAQKLTIVIMDLLLLIELCIGMYLANGQPDAFTLVFVRSFLMMCIPTLILAKVFVSRLRTKDSVAESTATEASEAKA